MSDDRFIINPEHRDIGPLDDRTRRTLRPAMVAFGVAALAVLAGALLGALAPEAFAAVGGWVTVVVVVVVAVVVGSLAIVRRMNAGASRPGGPAR